MNGNNTRNPKSAITAGVLALLLGVFGAHDWYLNDRKKASKHVILAIVAASAFVLNLILRTAITSVSSLGIANFMASFATVCRIIGWFALLINAVWAIIDAILLFLQGDEGLAEKGYHTLQKNQASPAATPSEATTNSPAQPDFTTPATPTPAAQSPIAGASSATSQPASAQPVTYHSSAIQQPNQPELLSQTLSTENVETAALTRQTEDGKTVVNPVILRKALLVVGGIIAVIVGGFLVKYSIDSALAVSYGDAYRIAKEILPNLTTAAKSSSCQYAVDYVEADYVDKPTYNNYIDVCRGLATEDGDLVTKLGETGAMKWDSGISTQYKEFKEHYDEVFANSEKTTQMVQALDLYQAWHDYVLAVNNLNLNSSETEFQEAADILRKSGNEVLAKYGDEWYYKEMDYINAYKTYWDMSYTDPNKDVARLEAEAKRNDLHAWVEEHRPDVTTLAPFDVPNLTPTYDSFTKLYELIRSGYENHYDYKSGDCQEAGRKVYCS